jgi:hypothetical protein
MMLIPGGQTFEAWDPFEISAVDLYSTIWHIHTVSAFKVFTPFAVGVFPLFHAPLFMPAGTWNTKPAFRQKKMQEIFHVSLGCRSSVGIATRYGLDGPGIEPRWERDFPHPSQPAVVPTQPSAQWVPGFFPGDKAVGAWRWPPTPSIAEVKERVEIYIYSPSGLSWLVLRWTLFLSRDSSVGIATRYGLDGPGIESRWGRVSLHPSRPTQGLIQPPIQWAQDLSRGIKRLEFDVTYPPQLTPRLKKDHGYTCVPPLGLHVLL